MDEKLIIDNIGELPYAVEEAVNRLRINIGFLGSKVKKIMIVSSIPNEGKSFVAFQLWRQMANTGTKSILVDADLRKSITIEKYGMRFESGRKIKGTSHYLSGDYDLKDAILHTEIENGDIIPNVDNVINPSLLLESDKFEGMLNELAEEYRYVFIDSPPLNLVSDGERIGNMCDGAILVARGGVTSKSVVKNSIQQLNRAGCPLLGIVLNRVESNKSGYYYKKYGGYGSYGGYGYYGNNND